MLRPRRSEFQWDLRRSGAAERRPRRGGAAVREPAVTIPASAYPRPLACRNDSATGRADCLSIATALFIAMIAGVVSSLLTLLTT